MYNPEELNEIQKRAVLDTEGAVLVTAGAGSGKTRLLTHRIAHLVKDLGVPPYNIMAITFTNKAAEEMRNRLIDMLGDIEGIWIFTFHAACVRILRRYIDRIGFGKNFTIYGEAETKALVKRLCKKHAQENFGDDLVKQIISEISNAKNRGIAPEVYEEVYKFRQDAEDIARIYADYQKALKANNALDYDDLLLETLRLLKTDGEAREYYQEKFRYIHIDEFQDTNIVQYEIAKILAQKHGNIFAVGDEDQCIYTWRGASIKNIFDFQQDFKCKVYKLEQNYRSTSAILAVANKIIKSNTQRLDKNLWTDNAGGTPVMCFAAATDGFEADYVVRTIYELTRLDNYNFSDCAILFRLNALTRPFEERFLQYGIPHRVFGGFKFYERKEIKDVLAYARLAVNTSDDEAAYRIINFPKRSIGEASIEKLRNYAASAGKSVFDVVTTIAAAPVSPFNSSLTAKLISFGNVLIALKKAAEGNLIEFFKYLLYQVLDVAALFSDDDGESRLENLNELINSVREYSKVNPDATVEDYLQTVSLYSDTDDMNDDDVVTLATVHSAKGLEFPVVFVVGLEDGVFPSMRVSDNGAERMEEERRLMYVAVTRAKERLFLTYAKSRYLYGDTKYGKPSRFLCECGLVEKPRELSDTYSSPSYSGVGDFARNSARASFGVSYPPKPQSSSHASDFGKKPEPVQSSGEVKKNITVGCTVMHKRLGKGKVLSIEKMGENMYAKIEFERGGMMVLAIDFAPITLVEE